jgi:predicted transcriptional regulator
VARPTKLTPEVQERILAAVRAGNYIEPSARSAGISPATFHRWIARGEKATSGIYRDFYEAVKRAEADAEVHAVAVIRKEIADGDWRAAAQFLERRFPDRWRRQQSIEHEGTQRLVVKTEDLADPELRKELRALTSRLAGAREDGPDGPGDAD